MGSKASDKTEQLTQTHTHTQGNYTPHTTCQVTLASVVPAFTRAQAAGPQSSVRTAVTSRAARQLFGSFHVRNASRAPRCLSHHHCPHTHLSSHSDSHFAKKSLALALFSEQKRLYRSWVSRGNSHTTQPIHPRIYQHFLMHRHPPCAQGLHGTGAAQVGLLKLTRKRNNNRLCLPARREPPYSGHEVASKAAD